MAVARRARQSAPPILDLEEFDESINILIYADSGAGKTVFGGSDDDVLFLATESGTISAKRQGSEAKVWRIKEWEDLQVAYLYLRDEEHSFKWVVLDSGTRMQHMGLRAILDESNAQNPARDLDIPAIQDHQKWQNMFKRFVQMFIDLPINVLMTATTMRVEDEEGDSLILPDFTGKGYSISQWVCAQMHVVGYLSVKRSGKGDDKDIWRRIQFQTVPPYFGKDRYNCLGKYNGNGACIRPFLDRVSLREVREAIENSGGGESSAANIPPVRRKAPTRSRAT